MYCACWGCNAMKDRPRLEAARTRLFWFEDVAESTPYSIHEDNKVVDLLKAKLSHVIRFPFPSHNYSSSSNASVNFMSEVKLAGFSPISSTFRFTLSASHEAGTNAI